MSVTGFRCCAKCRAYLAQAQARSVEKKWRKKRCITCGNKLERETSRCERCSLKNNEARRFTRKDVAQPGSRKNPAAALRGIA